MQNLLRSMRLIYAVLLVALAAYIYLPEWLHPHPSTSPDRIMLYAIMGMAVANVVVIFVMRRVLISPVETILVSDRENKAAQARWRVGQITTFALCLSVGLFGMMLRFIGFTLTEVLPLYLLSIALLLYFYPRDSSRKAV